MPSKHHFFTGEPVNFGGVISPGYFSLDLTLPATNIAPENRPYQKEIHLPTTNFQARAVGVSLNGGTPNLNTPKMLIF